MDLTPSQEIILRAYQHFLDSNRELSTQDDFNMASQAQALMDKLGITAYELNFKEIEK